LNRQLQQTYYSLINYTAEVGNITGGNEVRMSTAMATGQWYCGVGSGMSYGKISKAKTD
jgi:hypothetical protein